MKTQAKYNQILDALQELLENRDIQAISVSEIAQKAGIGKGSIYYYFPSKSAILDALVERNYEKPLQTAKKSCETDGSLAIYADGDALSGVPQFLLGISASRKHRRRNGKRRSL